MKVFGILNITSDSFSDGGEYLDPDKAAARALELVRDGADVIDIGAQSSNPEAQMISTAEEWSRLEPVIDLLQARNVPVSVDTFRPEVIARAIDKKVNYINNINAFADPGSLEVLAGRDELPELVLMYSSTGNIANKNTGLRPEQITNAVLSFLQERKNTLLRAGIPEEKLIFDPGMGFFLGSDPQLSLQVMRDIGRFREEFGPVFYSVSRKSFIGQLLGGAAPAQREAGTLAVEIWLWQNGADFIRTHNVRQLQDALAVLDAI